MKEQEIVDRIKFLIKELGYKQTVFAAKIGVDNSNLSKYLNGRLAVSEALVNRIVINLGVSKKWLLEGTDVPFAKQATPQVTTLQPESLIVTGDQRGTPVYDVDVTAGNIPRSRLFSNDLLIGYINLPGLVNPDCRVVRVSGDSMSPVLRSGDYIAVRELSNFQHLFWGQMYLVLMEDYRMVKYVRKHVNPDMVILRSENPNYDDMEIPRADIYEMMLVQHILHLDTRL